MSKTICLGRKFFNIMFLALFLSACGGGESVDGKFPDSIVTSTSETTSDDTPPLIAEGSEDSSGTETGPADTPAAPDNTQPTQPPVTPTLPGGPTNTAPTIAGTPRTSAREGSWYRFAPSYSDADGDTLTFSITNKPGWASFNTRTGVLSGTPGMQSAGTYSSIRISVTDGTDYAALPPFSIDVQNVNRAPSISGTPSTSIVTGNRYSFTPSATDADGDSLTFSISNKPAWASFNTRTGVLTGTPSTSDTGITRNITISVSDGQASRSLAAFDIEVQSNSTGTVTLNWTPPTENTDNSALTDLAGYKIHYGTSPGNYTSVIDITNPGLTSYVIDNLPAGTYYFVISAYNSSGVSSDYSNEASKVIN